MISRRVFLCSEYSEKMGFPHVGCGHDHADQVYQGRNGKLFGGVMTPPYGRWPLPWVQQKNWDTQPLPALRTTLPKGEGLGGSAGPEGIALEKIKEYFSKNKKM